ncbi:hypothetical protein HHK36_010458 [Tetracentron sinense]|uniref:Lethal giant larvae (Lgl)-like C-terminal domain-containing protein n=1 Tax=Tetracentron sinense TaxID=13715 RepID=A0A834ZEY0_TETSI|nr:hypothetical protein HHK36_010458 [Tetracentron sinense]
MYLEGSLAFMRHMLNLPGGNLNGLKINDVNPRLVFHYGIPPGSISLAYDSIQKILAISTKDGRIKLLGKDNTQALLESNEMVPSKFLQFVENQGILLNVTVQNHLEAKNICQYVIFYYCLGHRQETLSESTKAYDCRYVGDSLGNVSVLKLDQEPCQIVKMKYNIPLPASHGNTTEVAEDTAVMHILSQPTAESKRVLIIFRDGLIILWAIRESKVIFVTGGNKLHSLCHETKKVTSACWACPFGSKVVVGYSNGEIFFWSIPPISNSKSESETDKEELFAAQNVPICKLNLGYKMDKIPIISLKWAYADGKASRLYVMGACDSVSSNLLQVIILNEQTESRTVKLLLPLSEPCLDMEFISSTSDQSKHKQDSLLLLLKSGHLYVYDDSMIEKYLLQCQSRSPPSLPKEVMIKMPFADSSITVAKFITDDPNRLSIMDEEYILLAKNMPPLLPVEMKGKDGNHLNATHFSGFSKIKNLYITGHSNGAINFWDVSCPFLLPIFSVKQQSDDDLSLSGITVNALHFDSTCRVLVTGDQSGMVRIFKLKPEPFTTENSFLSLQGSTKRGSSHIIHSIKLIKVNGSVLSININRSSGHLAVGSDQGYVVLIDMEGPTVLFQKHMTSELCNSIICLQFETCSFHGFEKNILLVVTKDSSVLALESDTGNTLSTSMVRPKKPSRALFMQILDGQVTSIKGSNISDGLNSSKGNSSEDVIPKQPLLLLCSEKAVYLYSLMHVVRGVKKVNYKKKFHATCCWVSTFYTPSSDVGLILLFTSGKIEIRSLPELSLLKETLIRGFTFSTSKLYSDSETSICSSCNGELILANGDQEVFVVSVLSRKENYRLLDPISKVYKKDLIALQEGALFGPIIHKEKKKGIFSYVIKDMGNKAKHGPDREAEDPRASIEELSAIFSTANFLFDTENRDDLVVDEDEVELNIDDIDLEDTGEKPKGQNMIAALNKQKLTSKFQAIKGKLKQIKVKNEKTSAKEEHEDEKAGTVDQIKKRYGFPLSGDSSVAKIAENKLTENLRKLQGINTRTTEMQDTARSFSFMAKEVLRTAEQDKRSL